MHTEPRTRKNGKKDRRSRRARILRRTLIGLVIATAGIYGGNAAIIHTVNKVIYQRKLTFVDSTPRSALAALRSAPSDENDPSYAPLAPSAPFRKLDRFGAEAWDWSNQFSHYGAAGVTVFDANGDGRLDVYFCQDGQNWTRPTDDRGVLRDRPKFTRNGLYINLGNDAQGNPRFAEAAELAGDDDRYLEQELIVEDYLFPRRSAGDDTDRPGRGSNVAVAADFNNDGRMDLLVGNEPQGMFWSHPETQRVLMQFVNPVGREAKKSKQPLAAMGMHLIQGYEPRNSIHDKRESARGIEPEGANSLYINLGDRDGDGVPEWQDASRLTGIEGFRPTYSFSVADVDLDGDLDVFVGNSCDGDYWVGGSRRWAGGANCLYINQLAQTGKLSFREMAGLMDVDGVYDEDYPKPDYFRLRHIKWLPDEYSILFMKFEPYKPEPLVINGQQGEQGQISWSTIFQDVNDDGYPDIWVANDMGFLRLYLNQRGEKFVRADHARSTRSGYWMTFAAGDLDGDLREDLFVGNLGGAVMNHAFATPDPYDLFDPVILNATIFGQFYNDKHDTRHGLVDGADFRRELDNRVRHSAVMPPDVTLPHNYRKHAPEGYKLPPFDPNTINAYEFAWGATTFDAQNDGRIDLYYLGCLYGRGGGLFPISGTGPGRLLVNATDRSRQLRFVDLTAEHHLFNIEELNYDKLESDGYISRRSPLQNWRKRDVVHSYDRSSWSLQGPGIQEKVTNQDLIQAAENGRAAVAADLNGDGFEDLVLRNKGGYDSRSSKATNLKAMIDGRPQVIPAHNFNYPTPTNYEPGRTWLFVNQYRENGWIKVRLVDDSPDSHNRNAVGARVVLDNAQMHVLRCGDGGFLSNATTDITFGLADRNAHRITVVWPDARRTTTHHDLGGVRNRTVVIHKPHHSAVASRSR